MLCRELANRSKTIPRCVAQLGKRAAILAACLFATGFAQAATFDVNSPADVPDATPGDGQCETAAGNKVCTLRGAIQEANALAGADVIQLQANATYVLTRPRRRRDIGQRQPRHQRQRRHRGRRTGQHDH
jgi:CSLREA domain-containing protein